MGVGYPENIIEAVKRGIDMFDCVIPTREARHGKLYLWNDVIARSGATKQSKSSGLPRFARNDFSVKGRPSSGWYKTINITNAKFTKDKTPINSTNLKNYSRAYLHHLFRSRELLVYRLLSIHNLQFMMDLMGQIREAITEKRFEKLKEDWVQ